jgi:hypothetical protein
MNSLYKFCFLLIFIFLLFPSFSNGLKSDSLDNFAVAELTDDWLYYDEEFKTFFPYLNGKSTRPKSLSQLIDLDKYKSYSLNFIAAPGLTLFIDNKLYYRNESNSVENAKILIDQIVGPANIEKELLTFYHPNGKLPLDNLFIGHTSNEKIVNVSQVKPSLLLSREFSNKQNVFILTFLVILCVIAIIRNRYPKKFYEFFRFGNVLPFSDEDVVWDLTNVPILLMVLVNALCSGLILFLIQENFNLSTLKFINVFYNKPFIGIALVSGMFFFLYILKFIYLKILGWIFNLSGLVKIQFFELMKVSLKINLFLTIVTMIMYCSAYINFKLDFDYFFNFTIISLFIVLLRVGYVSFKLSGFRNIYLFSYLCTTEILPLLIIVKLILF